MRRGLNHGTHASAPPPYMSEMRERTGAAAASSVHPSQMQPAMVYLEKKGGCCRCLGRFPWLSTLAFTLGLGGAGLMGFGAIRLLEVITRHYELSFTNDDSSKVFIAGFSCLGLIYLALIGCSSMCSGANKEKCCRSCCCRCLGLFSLFVMICICVFVGFVLYLMSCVFVSAALASAVVQMSCGSESFLQKSAGRNFTSICLDSVHKINELDWESILDELDIGIPSFNTSALTEDTVDRINTEVIDINFSPGNLSYLIPNSVCYKWNDDDACEEMLEFAFGLDYLALGSSCLFLGNLLCVIALSANWAHVRDHGRHKREEDKVEDNYYAYNF
ncbi:uncharacterized protein LOC134848306 isoform X2 [Symsagittifera roscoffensis]|uniref:uncharacterized protein LOC134848306 isoform X2 n=1 Tax=Symsagittifera roscoffensis TaxID=84072 RepID=UPI00307C09BC